MNEQSYSYPRFYEICLDYFMRIITGIQKKRDPVAILAAGSLDDKSYMKSSWAIALSIIYC